MANLLMIQHFFDPVLGRGEKEFCSPQFS